MFLLTFSAHPDYNSAVWETTAGAFINSWIVADSFEDAHKIASEMIEENGWIIEELDDWEVVDPANFADNPDVQQYYEQALIDKQVCVYHVWPHGGDDGEIEH